MIARYPQHRCMVEWRKELRPLCEDRAKRIGEPDPALAVDRQVTGMIVVLAIKQRIDCRRTAIGQKFNQPSTGFLATIELAARTDRETTCPAAVFASLGDLATGRVQAHQTLLFAQRKQQALAIPDDTIRRALERAGHAFEFHALYHRSSLTRPVRQEYPGGSERRCETS
jgi:hypothetical protein